MKKDIEILYKYRSLSNLKRLIEIVLDSKLYASRYKELNDPMEGYYSYSREIVPYKKEINRLKKESLICSLSKSNYIGMMWIMYADEGKGCHYKGADSQRTDPQWGGAGACKQRCRKRRHDAVCPWCGCEDSA